MVHHTGAPRSSRVMAAPVRFRSMVGIVERSFRSETADSSPIQTLANCRGSE